MLSLDEAVRKLAFLLQEGMGPSTIDGSCLINFPKGDHSSLLITIKGSSVTIEKVDAAIPVTSKVEVLDSSLLVRWGCLPHTITFRTPEIGNYFAVSGDIKLIQTLVNLVRRPPPEVQARISKIRHRCKGYITSLRSVSIFNGFQIPSINEFLKKHIPILCKGGLKNELIVDFSLEDLLNQYGDVVVKNNIRTRRNLALREFLECSFGSSYSQGCAIPNELKNIFTFPFITSQQDRIVQLWAGFRTDGKPLTPIHLDAHHSFLAHVHGIKKVLLFSPDQFEYLYPQKGMLYSQACFVDSHSPNYDIHPDYRKASSIEVRLEPGDLLIIPAGWYHVVYGLTPVLSYSCFVEAGTEIMGVTRCKT